MDTCLVQIPLRKFGGNFQIYWCGKMAGLESEIPNNFMDDVFLEEKVYIFFLFFYYEKIFFNQDFYLF